MLLGEKSELTDEWSDTFRTAGIAHLLAVSGLHVALLCGLFAMGQGGAAGSRFRWSCCKSRFCCSIWG